jgi:hypothetical protein
MNTPAEQPSFEAIYNECLEAACRCTSVAQLSHLNYYWELGAIVIRFIQAAGEKPSRAGIERLASELTARIPGATFGATTLYCARSVNLMYRQEDLPEMVSKGVLIGHLKLLASVDEETRPAVVEKLYGDDGKAVTIKALEETIQEHRKQSVRKATDEAIQTARAPAPVKPTPPAAEPSDNVGDTGSADNAVGVAAPVQPDDGKTKSVGAHQEKEFSQSPLKPLKQIDSTCTKLLSIAPDVFIVIGEASKIGFDSDKAQANYKAAFENAQAGLMEVKQVVDKLLEQMTDLAP